MQGGGGRYGGEDESARDARDSPLTDARERSLTHARSKNERLTLRKSSRAPSDARLYVTARSVRLSHLSIGLGSWRLEAGAAPHDEGQGEGEGRHDSPTPGSLRKGPPSATCTTSMAAWAAGADITSAMAAWPRRRRQPEKDEVTGGARSAADPLDDSKLNRGNTSRSFEGCRALRRSARAKGLRGPGRSAIAPRRRPERSAGPSRSYRTVTYVILSHDRDHSAVDRPGAGRASRRQTPREPLVAEEKNTPRACARFRAGDARSTATLGAQSRSVRRHNPRASPRRSRPSGSCDARRAPRARRSARRLPGAVSGGYDSGSFRIATHLLLDADGIDGGGSLRDDGGAAGGLAGASRDAGGERNLAGLSEDSHGFRGCV